MPHTGSRLAWKLGDIYQVGCLSDHVAKTESQWIYSHKWQTFDNFLSACGCPHTLLRSLPNSVGLQQEASDIDHRRVLPYPAVHTFGLVALLAKLAWSPAGLRCESAARGLEEFLKSLLGGLLGTGEYKFVFSLSSVASWDPPCFWASENGITVTCMNGVLNLSEFMMPGRPVSWHRYQKSFAQCVLRDTGGDIRENMSLVELCRVLALHMLTSTKTIKFFGELCMNISHHIERKLCPASSRSARILEQPGGALTLRADGEGSTKHECDQLLFRYFEGCSDLAKSATSVSLAADASRVGKKGMILGAFLDCKIATAFWMPPQVTADVCAHVQLSILKMETYFRQGNRCL